MFDLVPLARARWDVTHGDRQSGPIRELLQFPLPEADTRPLLPPASAVMTGDRARG
jgi:hypothetical protein